MVKQLTDSELICPGCGVKGHLVKQYDGRYKCVKTGVIHSALSVEFQQEPERMLY